MPAQLSDIVPRDMGERLHSLARELFPLNRSITGEGVRATLSRLAEILPLRVFSVASGTRVFDWVVPNEWNLREAYIEDATGRRIVDARDHNLHVVGYSVPIERRMSLAELRPHLHTLPDRPDWIPYRTSYYKETWGFCLKHRQLEALTEQEYYVRIDATLEPGVLNFAEALIRGERQDEFLISAHVCHPSLCNDNLSGIAIAAFLGQELGKQRPSRTYRILFVPGTIGSIAWLATRPEVLPHVKDGLVAALLGGPGPITYKKTRSGDAYIDRVVQNVLRDRGGEHRVIDFTPWGYDERQFNSPGIGLNVGRLTRAPEGCYPEYHTSADDLGLVRPEVLDESFRVLCSVIDIVEADAVYRNLSPCGEPQLGKYGLYDAMGGGRSVETARLAMLWVLNLSDGAHSLLAIAERSGLPFSELNLAAARLEKAGLLQAQR